MRKFAYLVRWHVLGQATSISYIDPDHTQKKSSRTRFAWVMQNTDAHVRVKDIKISFIQLCTKNQFDCKLLNCKGSVSEYKYSGLK